MVSLSNHEIGHSNHATTSSFDILSLSKGQDEVYCVNPILCDTP